MSVCKLHVCRQVAACVEGGGGGAVYVCVCMPAMENAVKNTAKWEQLTLV